MSLLNKVLPELFLPLGVGLLLLTFGLMRRRRGPMVAALLLLLVSSHPYVGWFAMRTAEGWAERRPIESVTAADAIVVLSTGRPVAPGPEAVHEWNDPDRFFGGVELFKAGKAPRLVFTGALSGADLSRDTEGTLLARAAIALGVPPSQIVVTGLVGNTANEAQEVRRVLPARPEGPPRVLLVTSASHMPRAAQQFRAAGFSVDPFPVDFRSSARFQFTLGRMIPSPAALTATHTALREQYGRLFYWLSSRL